LNRGQQHTHTGKPQQHSRLFRTEYCGWVKGDDCPSLFSTADTTSGVLGPGLGTPVQEQRGHTGGRQVMDHENGEGVGTFVTQREAEGNGEKA